jgi:cytoskeleton protein RodZ
VIDRRHIRAQERADDATPRDAEPVRTLVAGGPGAMLRAAREAQGWSREEVADALRLAVSVVADLEEENWPRLRSATFTRGYYRAYAKLLDLDVEQVLSAYRAAAPSPETDGNRHSRSVRSSIAGSSHALRSNPVTVLGFAAVAVVLFVGLLIWWAWPNATGEPVGTAPAASAPPRVQPAVRVQPVTDQSQLSARAAAPPAPIDVSEPEGGRDAAEAAIATPDEPGPVFAPADDDVDTDWVLDANASTATSVRRLTAAGNDYLVFRFTDDCWVDVKSLDGRPLYSDLSRAGDELIMVGEGPFRILLGYAPAVELTFNGEEVAVRARTRNNVASLTLGR